MARKSMHYDEIRIDDFLNPNGGDRESKESPDLSFLDHLERSDRAALESADEEIVNSDEVTNILPHESATTAPSVAAEIGEECINGVVNTDNATSTQSKPTSPTKRRSATTSKQSLEEYHKLYLQVPKINNGKPIFISDKLREKLYEVTIRLGGRKMSPSGFVENLLHHHIETYGKDWEKWLNK